MPRKKRLTSKWDLIKIKVLEDEIKYFKSCLVCPERWKRKSDIASYKKKLRRMNFFPDAVMTSKKCIKYWENKK